MKASRTVAVTCRPMLDERRILEPVVLVEILWPSNEAETRESVRACTTIPTVQEIVVLCSTKVAAEVTRQRRPDGFWPPNPIELGPEDRLDLPSPASSCSAHRALRPDAARRRIRRHVAGARLTRAPRRGTLIAR
jgi:hypothetical protein